MSEKIQQNGDDLGLFLVNKGLISEKELNEAFILKKDNPQRKIGEILVTMGSISKDDLIMAIEMYIIEINSDTLLSKYTSEWLDQGEIDVILKNGCAE